MYKIAVIGSGQLGSRHLQGIVGLGVECTIYVVDTSVTSLEVARQRVDDLDTKLSEIKYLTSQCDLPAKLDYVVVATSANVRLSVIKQLLVNRKIQQIVLEKVLFQYYDEYQEAVDLFKGTGVNVWVNCPRRGYSVYKEIKEFFNGSKINYLDIQGGQWGMGCNSIHFVDLFGFLTDGYPSQIQTNNLDKEIFPSKRAGYYEFSGRMCGEIGEATFGISSKLGSSMRHLITIRSDDKTCIVDERAGKAFLCSDEKKPRWSTISFNNPLTSELSTSLARDALANKELPIASLSDSTLYHLPLIEALIHHANKSSDVEFGLCPIT